MAHNIAMNVRTGNAMMMTAGSLPWHFLGKNVAEAKTWRETMELAEIGWAVEERAIYSAANLELAIPGYKAIVRADTGQTLGIHKLGYRIFQNEDAFLWTETLIPEGAFYESAGALGIGEKIWVLARIPQADYEIGNGDKHVIYLLVCTSHDGSIATTILTTDTRVVCNNTLNVALGHGNKAAAGKLKVKHTKQAEAKLTQAQAMIRDTITTADGLKSKLIELSEKRLTKPTLDAITDRLFPKSKAAVPALSQTRRDNMLAEILASYEVCDGGMFPEQRGTPYALLNAVTDYTDHLRGTRRADDNQSVEVARAQSALFGSGATLKSEALDVIYELSANEPSKTSTVYDMGSGNGSAPTGGSILDAIIYGYGQ